MIFRLQNPGSRRDEPVFFCVDGRKRSDAGQVRVRGGSDGKYGNAVLATTGGQERAGCPWSAERGAVDRQPTKKSRSERREHPARSCPNVE